MDVREAESTGESGWLSVLHAMVLGRQKLSACVW